MKIAAFIVGLLAILSVTYSDVNAKPVTEEEGSNVNECTPADVVFVLDVSTSIWSKYFREHVLTFVYNVSKSLDVGPDPKQSRVGAVTFSDRVWLEFYLDKYLEKDDLLAKIKRIRLRGGNTYTHKALEFVDLNLFRADRGSRDYSSHVVIVITDGASREKQKTLEAASSLRNHGATVFAIGVGDNLNVQELHGMASDPSDEFVYMVTDFEALAGIHSELVLKTCFVTTTPVPTTTTTTPTTTTTTPTTTTTTPTTTTPTTTTTTPTTTTTTPTTTTTTTTTPTTTTTTPTTTTTTPTTTTTTPTTTTTTPTTTTTTPTTTTTTPTTTTTTPTTTTSTPTTTTTTPTTTTTTKAPTTTPKDQSMDDSPHGDMDTIACINRPADVYFVLDSSSSIWIVDFQERVLEFVRDVIDIFDIGSDRTRVGVITFSDAPRTVFGLDSHVHKDELLKAVNKDNVEYRPGLTYTAEALQQARMNFYHEGRDGVKQVIILLTDGQSKSPNSTAAIARAARNDGVAIFAVGVGKGVDIGELHAVASQPSEDFVLMVDDFNALSAHNVLLAARTCGSKATVNPPVKPLGDSFGMCDMQHADVLFAYDSGMLGGIVTAQITSTLHRVSATLDAMTADVQIGTLTSSSSSQCVKQPSASLSSSLAFSKYANSVVRSQTSEMASFLKYVRLSGFTAKNGHRMSAKKVLVIVLDPSSTSRLSQVALEAVKIRGDDTEVFVITSGRQGGRLVDDIVSELKSKHIIVLPALDFSNYVYASDVIVSYLCGSSWR